MIDPEFKQFEWRRIRGALLQVGVGLLAASLLLAYSWARYTAVSGESERSHRSFTLQQSSLEQRRSIKAMSEAYREQFLLMQSQHYFRDDAKLHWLEKIDQASKQFALPSVRYDISQRRPHVTEDDGMSGSGLGVYETKIDLRLGLLHEGDLLAFHKLLRDAGLGLFALDGCEMARVKKELPVVASEVLISAHCTYTSYQFVFDDPQSDSGDGELFAAAGGGL